MNCIANYTSLVQGAYFRVCPGRVRRKPLTDLSLSKKRGNVICLFPIHLPHCPSRASLLLRLSPHLFLLLPPSPPPLFPLLLVLLSSSPYFLPLPSSSSLLVFFLLDSFLLI